jgi:hypothetical protein
LFLPQDSDIAVDDFVTSSLGGDDLQTAAMDQDKNLGKSVADSPEASAESTEGGHSSSSDSFFDTTPGSVPKEQILSAGSTADDDNMPTADDSNIGSTGLTSHDLAIVPHASHSLGHGCDDGDAVDSEVIPFSFSMPQSVLTSRVTGMLYSVLIPLSCVGRGCTHAYFYMLCIDLPQALMLPWLTLWRGFPFSVPPPVFELFQLVASSYQPIVLPVKPL